MTVTAAMTCGASTTPRSNSARYRLAIDAPVGEMKSANAYGSPASAAQMPLCGDDPRSHTAGASRRPGSVSARRRAPEGPQGGPFGPAGQRLREPRERVVVRQRVAQVAEELGELLREVV